jgi:hypothetical protein
MMKKSILLGTCLLTLLALEIGCGPRAPKMEEGRGGVTGTVSLDGKLIGGGNITIVSAKDPMMSVTLVIRKDGTFLVDNAPTGDVIVAVDTEPARVLNPEGYVPIPKKYSSVETSGLTGTITKGGKEPCKLSFDLKSK